MSGFSVLESHLKGAGHLSLVDGQLAVHPPKFADEAPGQDQEQGHMNQVRPHRAEAAPFQEIDLLVREGLMAAVTQLPAQGGRDAGVGIDLRRPGNPGPVPAG